MSLHDIHSCSKICSENAELKQRLSYIKRQKDEIQRQLNILMKERNGEIQKISKPVMKVASIQTDPKPWFFRPSKQETASKETTQTDIKQINKVLEMHSQLLKRYDKEVKLNMTYADSVSDLNIRLAEKERQLREEKEKNLNLDRELHRLKDKMGNSAEAEDPVLRDVVKERNMLVKENKKLKSELKGLDHNFFDELEDLKYSLLQSTKLNIEYEKSMKTLCTQYRVPFVAVQTVTCKLKTR